MANLKITLVKSLNSKIEKQVLTAHSLGLKKIGDVTEQPDNAQTQGKIKVISHLIKVDEA
ncbi:MAG: 50S ribosomal protein L30 [Ruminococcus sp.]|nr:50S ribosomal protein L30 [Ruminococcus sp.]